MNRKYMYIVHVLNCRLGWVINFITRQKEIIGLSQLAAIKYKFKYVTIGAQKMKDSLS